MDAPALADPTSKTGKTPLETVLTAPLRRFDPSLHIVCGIIWVYMKQRNTWLSMDSALTNYLRLAPFPLPSKLLLSATTQVIELRNAQDRDHVRQVKRMPCAARGVDLGQDIARGLLLGLAHLAGLARLPLTVVITLLVNSITTPRRLPAALAHLEGGIRLVVPLPLQAQRACASLPAGLAIVPRPRSAAAPAILPRLLGVPRHGFGNHCQDWIFVANVPHERAERYLFDRLARRNIDIGDIFLILSRRTPTRFAYIGLRSADDCRDAIDLLDGLHVDGRSLRAGPFKDQKTGSGIPGMADSSPERRYVGAQAQADRPPDLKDISLFLLHIPANVTEQDILRFVERSVSRQSIGKIRVLPATSGSLAYVNVRTENDGRRAILDLDGEVLLGSAVRVSWDCGPPSFEGSCDTPANQEPLVKNRYAQLAATAASDRLPASPSSLPDAPSSLQVDALPASSTTGADAIKPSESIKLDVQRDLDRLRSFGLSSDTLGQVQQAWLPLEQAPGGNPSRQVHVEASFGFVPQGRAKHLLETQASKATFPEDLAMQKRYEAFLQAQAGMSKDYYTVFFGQLDNFNSTSKLFSELATEGE
ncbi:hypothetical protein JCM11641_000276 [Rhodosporidiobolus odoratus]